MPKSTLTSAADATSMQHRAMQRMRRSVALVTLMAMLHVV
jgi:hypothetical protein